MAENAKGDPTLRWDAMSNVRGEVLRRVGDLGGEAEDCLHEAMLRLSTRPDLELDPRRLVPFLVQATKWRAVDRRRAREASHRLASAGGPQTGGACPEDVASGHQLMETLGRAVINLPVREREVIRHRAAGFDAGETARRLGISYKAQEGALTRARAKLRAVIAFEAALAAIRFLRRRGRRYAAARLSASLVAGALLAAPLVYHPARGMTSTPHVPGQFGAGHAEVAASVSVRMASPALRRIGVARQAAVVGTSRSGPSVGGNAAPLVMRPSGPVPAPTFGPGMHRLLPDARRLAGCVLVRPVQPSRSACP